MLNGDKNKIAYGKEKESKKFSKDATVILPQNVTKFNYFVTI